MVVVVLLSALKFCFMVLSMAVLDAVAYVEVGVNAIASITGRGLVNLLVSILANRSAVPISWCSWFGVDGEIASGSYLEVLVVSLITVNFEAMMAASPILARATLVVTTC